MFNYSLSKQILSKYELHENVNIVSGKLHLIFNKISKIGVYSTNII